MYVYPVQFPQISNREDLLLAVSLFDDDTGQPVKMDGTTTALPQAFTSSAWTVTDGAISTASATSITIPTYPIGNQLSALALTVGEGLAILAGDPIAIADTATGLNSMTGYVTSYVPATGALVVQIGCTFVFEIRREGPRSRGWNDGYISSYDAGTSNESGPILRASLGNGITYVDIGIIQIMIPASSMQRLRGATYSVALTVTDSVNTRQMFFGNLPVQWGGVSPVTVPAAASTYNPNIF
jgi:hypothetical protein